MQKTIMTIVPITFMCADTSDNLARLHINHDRIIKETRCDDFDARWSIPGLAFGGDVCGATITRRPNGLAYDVEVETPNVIRRVNNYRRLVEPVARALAFLVHRHHNIAVEEYAAQAGKKYHKDEVGEVTILKPTQFIASDGTIASTAPIQQARGRRHHDPHRWFADD